MAKQMDVLQPHNNKNTGKTYWNRLGTAYENKDGSYSVTFNSLPIPTYDEQYGMQVRVLLKEQLQKDGNNNGQDIPF